MLNVIMLNVAMLSVITLGVVMLSVVVLSVAILSVVMPSVVMLSVIMLNLVAPFLQLVQVLIIHSGEPSCSPLLAFPQHYSHRKRLAMSKRSSFFNSGVSDEERKPCYIDTCGQCYKTFFPL
jgi:hypothetical protein